MDIVQEVCVVCSPGPMGDGTYVIEHQHKCFVHDVLIRWSIHYLDMPPIGLAEHRWWPGACSCIVVMEKTTMKWLHNYHTCDKHKPFEGDCLLREIVKDNKKVS